MSVSLVKVYAPGTRVLWSVWHAWGEPVPPVGRVIVCLCKGRQGHGPMCVRWDDGLFTHEATSVAPVSNIYR